MTDKVQTENADAVSSVVEGMSTASYANRRAQQLSQMFQKSEPSAETEETEEIIEDTEAVSEQEESGEEVLSKLNLDSLDDLSEEDLRELSEKLGSRAVARYGELTAKRKAAEERLAQLEAKLANGDKNPLEKPEKADTNNPYKDIQSIEELQQKHTEASATIEWAEDLLESSDDYGANDVVFDEGDQSFTKSDVRRILKNARKARDKYLPQQYEAVQRVEVAKQTKEALKLQMKNELKWMQDADSDVLKEYEATVQSDAFKQLQNIVEREAPEMAARLDYIVAHAANSIYGVRKLVDTKPTGQRMKAPSSPETSTAAPDRVKNQHKKATEAQRSQFLKTGRPQDFINMRLSQFQR